jgi:hypothetical protein
MAEVHITKSAAAQRQLDAAIRILFSGEDELAVHTLAFAAHTIVCDLDKKNGKVTNRVFEETLDEVRAKFPGAFAEYDALAFRKFINNDNRRGANFLKHAEQDHAKSLNPSALTTDHLLLEACSIYIGLGFSPTKEMQTFGRWHLAVYPSEPDDRINTAAGEISSLEREQKLEFGLYLLEKFSD